METSKRKLRTVKCPACGERATIYLDEPLGPCSQCGCIMIEDPNIDYKESSSILDEASKIINGDRQDSYGKPEDSFQIIASFWNVYIEQSFKTLDVELSALDVAHMMTLFKIARMLGQKPNRDNYTDAAGYLAIAADRLIRWPELLDPDEFAEIEKAVLCRDCDKVFTVRKYSTDVICPDCGATNCVLIGKSNKI